MPIEEQESNIIESHWSNWLAKEESQQSVVNKLWISYYQNIQKQTNRYIAKNSEQFYSQWIYHKYCSINEPEPGKVTIDNSLIPNDYYEYGLVKNLVLKIKLEKNSHISSARINRKKIASYYEDCGFGFLYLPQLGQQKYLLEYEQGDNFMDTYVFNDGTYNIYSLESRKAKTSIDIRLYGKQQVQICGIEKPFHISISNSSVVLLNHQYQHDKRVLKIILKAHDIQGENAHIDIVI